MKLSEAIILNQAESIEELNELKNDLAKKIFESGQADTKEEAGNLAKEYLEDIMNGEN